jgi:hypothetical protein
MGAHKRSATRRPVTHVKRCIHLVCVARLESVCASRHSNVKVCCSTGKQRQIGRNWWNGRNAARATPALYSLRAKFAKSFAGASGDRSRAAEAFE